MIINQYQNEADSYQNNTSIANFIPLDKIGEGSFSSVYKVRRITDDQVYALKKIKIVALKQKQRQNALNQIRILASLNSRFIIQYREAFFDQKLNLLCIVMEFANEGDLQKKIESYKRSCSHFPENEIWKAAYHTIKGLDILHSKSILHRDIKSANIFISDGVYKLGDLNVSKVQDNIERLAYTQTGTPYYASPEVWRDQPYDSKSDIWSIGCVLYEMCTFKPPFKGKNLQQLYHNVQKGLYEPLPIYYSQQLSDFIGNCLRLNPKHRLSCKQLLSSSILQKKCYELNLKSQLSQINDQLLKTIKLPSDLRELKKKLPKSKYSCSIDSIGYKRNKQTTKINCNCHLLQRNGCQCQTQNQFINPVKKYSHADYYLQLARKKRQNNLQSSNNTKINRVISEGSINKNPQQGYYNRNNNGSASKKYQDMITKPIINAQSSRHVRNPINHNKNTKLILQQNKCLGQKDKINNQNLRQKSSIKQQRKEVLFSDRVQKYQINKSNIYQSIFKNGISQLNDNTKSRQDLSRNYSQLQLLNRLPTDTNKNQNSKQKYHINIKLQNNINEQKQIQEQKIRKLSHDQQTLNSNKIILNHLSLMKKLSQSSVSKCLSNRNLQIQDYKQKQNNIKLPHQLSCKDRVDQQQIQSYLHSHSQVCTQRIQKERKQGKNLVINKKNEQLAQISRKVQQKRKQLRKIGSIQRLQSSKNIHHLSYRSPNLILNPHIKKSGVHISNILLKSPTSTQDELSLNANHKLKQKQRASSQKRLVISPQINKVNSTPYMVGLSDVPRMKRIMQNLNQNKKAREKQIKNKLINNRFNLNK